MQAVEPGEIEQILELTDRLGIHRESVAIPLGRRGAGGVRRMPGGKLQITVAEEVAFASWIEGLEQQLRTA